MLIPNSNIFYQPNLERKLSNNLLEDNIIGSNYFRPNQFSMNYFWQIVEDNSVITNISIKSSKFLIDKIGIDLKSSIQLIYDVFGMMIEVLFFWYIIVDVIKLFVFFQENYILVLPHLVKICEICENREQFIWIKNSMTSLQATVPIEDTLSHQVCLFLCN